MLAGVADETQETQERESNHFVLHRILGYAQEMQMHSNLDSMTAWNRSSARCGNRKLAHRPAAQGVGFPGLLVRFSTLLFARTLL